MAVVVTAAWVVSGEGLRAWQVQDRVGKAA